ncbi:MAG: head GIN domain-containing protein [Bacteroidales bacterium]
MKQKNMLQRPAFIALLFALTITCSQCSFAEGRVIKGDGHVVTTTHQVTYFNALDLQGAFSNVQLIPGTDLMVTMETDQNLQDLFLIETTNETLQISSDRETILQPTSMHLTIIYPDLNKITIGGACKISSVGKIAAENLSLEISGAADLDLQVEVGFLRTQVSGAGNIVLEGLAEEHEIRLSGASNLNAANLATESTQVHLSGAGSASVNATTSLEANLSGIGKITYSGDPKEKIINKSGLGSISAR